MVLLTIKEVSERLKISVSLAYSLVARGELASYQIGTCRRVSEGDLEAYLLERRSDRMQLPKSTGRHF